MGSQDASQKTDNEVFFTRLYEQSHHVILGFCTRHLLHVGDAEDATAEAFLVAWRKINTVRELAEPSAWLMQTAKLIVRNTQRRERRRNDVRIRTHDLVSVAREPFECVSANLALATTIRGIEALDARDRDIIISTTLTSLPRAEVGRRLQLDPSQISKRLYAIRQHLHYEAASALRGQS